MVATSVRFQTSDAFLQKLIETAELKAKENIKDFGSRKVLIEGGGYEKIWLETQPMGGEIYAKRNLEVGLNNQLLFMENQRADGRLPGSIALVNGKITPQFDKFQGFCFPSAALNMYYLAGKDPEYLTLLYQTLERFDRYLWKVRDSDGDGCLETWCKYDTGEDHAVRYGDAPDAWDQESAPTSYTVVPMASMDIMSFSYSARETLAKISRILGRTEDEALWRQKARQVQKKIIEYLWCEEAGACFDRDKHHQVIPVVTHNNLRAMYWNSFTQQMADQFVAKHLLNPQEFWTPMPLPSVAVNDPMFRNIKTNNWSGQVEALTYQRAIRALENYGYDELLPTLGMKLFQAIGTECIFVQQYDPFTSQPSTIALEGEQDHYGPAILSVLEYAARMYGIHIEQDEIFWGCYGDCEGDYQQVWGEHVFEIRHLGGKKEAWIDGQKVFEAASDVKVITDLNGIIQSVRKLSAKAEISQVKVFGNK